MELDSEKQEIIDCEGSVLVTANPGTGKTLLLAGKYVDLIQNGLKPEEILCLTFTNKAKSEMEERIIEMLKEAGIEIDLSRLNVFTFHAYCLDRIDESGIISSNLLRYSIYRYLKENEVLNYGDVRLLETIVPKMENLIRYLKSFGILPDKINISKAKEFLQDDNKFTKQELELFLGQFVKIFENYEKIKHGKGLDYADLLIEFLNLRKVDKFKYVLVDELQDVNELEAEIALKSGETFMAVGDQKQAIFGFQGGSIINFKKFQNSKRFVLSKNYRSTDQILEYAKKFFSEKTTEDSYREALKNLRSAEGKNGPKPTIVEIKEDVFPETANLVKELVKGEGKVAVIARTNTQIMALSKELSNQGIEHSSTHFSASTEAKQNIIAFLRGVFSSECDFVKNAMFTPFFPLSLQEAFELSTKKLSIEDILEKAPEFKKLRESISGIEDIHTLFREKILPVAIAYGKEYVFAALSVQDACAEAISVLENKNLESFAAYLESSDLLAQESDIEQKVILTTVHKAKGKQFETVIYVPQKIRDMKNFQDRVVEAILKSHGINADEELEEESLRTDFVALTRAKKQLFIITEKPSNYLNDFAAKAEAAVSQPVPSELDELEKRAYNLFVNRNYDKAKQLLETKKPWLKEFVKKHFESLDHISFSALSDSPYDYFTSRILGIQTPTTALSLGSDAHKAAEKILKGEKPEIRPELEPYIKNMKTLLAQIQKNYPQVVAAELEIYLPLSKIIQTTDTIRFKGVIDGVFKKSDEYFIVDWKTSAKDDGSAGYRQQLAVYKKAYALSKNIPPEKIKVAIGYIGLRRSINDGTIKAELDDKQPAPTAFETISKKIQKLLEWRKNTDKFFEELLQEEVDDVLWRSLAEEISKKPTDSEQGKK